MNENQIYEEIKCTRLEIPLSPKSRAILQEIADGKGVSLNEFLTRFVVSEIHNYIDEQGFNNETVSEMEKSIERYFGIKIR